MKEGFDVQLLAVSAAVNDNEGAHQKEIAGLVAKNERLTRALRDEVGEFFLEDWGEDGPVLPPPVALRTFAPKLSAWPERESY